MEIFLLTFLFLLVAIGGLALGVIAGRAPIKGSCGGLACHKGVSCGACKAKREAEDAE